MNDTYVIDGNNVCGWYENIHHQFSIVPLLTVIIALLENNDNFYCVFDASIFHILEKHGKMDESEFIEKLLSNYPNNFFRVTGSSRADGTVLHCAEHYRTRIITNDLFRDYKDKYPWLEDKFNSRLIQGNLQPNGLLTIDKLPYGNLKIEDNLESSSKRLIELLLLEESPKDAHYNFQDHENDSKESKSTKQNDFKKSKSTKQTNSSNRHRSTLENSFSKKTNLRRNSRKKSIIITGVLLLIGIVAIMQTTTWGLDYKINSKHKEILNLDDQIKNEKAKIEEINDKYSTLKFWQKKSREDIIEIEKAKIKIEILDAKRSEVEDERAMLKKAIGRGWVFRPLWFSLIVGFYSSFIFAAIIRKKK